jgi:hypothetical protein
MAAVLIPIVGVTLAEAQKSLGLAAISWGGTKVLQFATNVVTGAVDPADQIRTQLATAIKDLEHIKSSIHGVSIQIRDLRIDTKVDQLQTQVDNIHALYDRYTIAAVALAKEAQNHASNPEVYASCVSRCTLLGNEVVNGDLYRSLTHINSALVENGDQSLLALLHAAHVNDGKDFLAQYCILKVVLLRYFLVEVQAIVLFDLARQDDNVKFGDDEHKGLIKKIDHLIDEQQKKFDSLIHVNVRRLAEHMLKNGNERTLVTIRANNGTNIGRGKLMGINTRVMENWVVRPIISPGYRWILDRFGSDREPPPADYNWGFQSRPDPPLNDSNMGDDHWFSVTADINRPEDRSLEGSATQDNALTVSWHKGVSRYKLTPTPNGHFRIENGMQYHPSSTPQGHTFLEVGEDGLLHNRWQANVNEARQHFQIELWDMSKTYDPEAMTPEQHDLEGDNGYWRKPKDSSCITM